VVNRHENKETAVGHIPSGLFIVAAHDSQKMTGDGYLASWIQQISFEPMLVSLAIKPGRPCYELIKSGHNFSINIVGDHEKNYLKHFWKGYDPNLNPFSEIKHELVDDTLVITEAKSSLICRLKEIHKPGDHEVVVAEVLASYVHHEQAKPMVHIRKSGKDY
jgi:flavin reductase (DIM6/NTAB) family NADH-FMN oxidoreductase RutF